MTAVAVVLYEDSQRGAARFPLHMLFLTCIADRRVGEEGWPPTVAEQLGEIIAGNPRGGANKVLRDLEDATHPMYDAAQQVVVVLDDDAHTRSMAGLEPDASVVDSIAAITAKAGQPDKVSVFLPYESLEKALAILSSACRAQGVAVAEADERRAVIEKKRQARDDIIRRATYEGEGRKIRAQLLSELPSLVPFINALDDLSKPADAAETRD